MSARNCENDPIKSGSWGMKLFNCILYKHKSLDMIVLFDSEKLFSIYLLKEKMQIPYIFLSRKLNERKKALNYSQSK
jgi:hypothetical protein